MNDKGLTKSRNYAIKHSEADVCLLCDDDEVFSRNYEEGILTAYRDLPEADVIIFNIGNRPAHWGDMPKSLDIWISCMWHPGRYHSRERA